MKKQLSIKRMAAVFCTILLAFLPIALICPIETKAADRKWYTTTPNSLTVPSNLSSDPATRIVQIARANNEKTKSQLGYTDNWCAEFISDCAKLAGIDESVIPRAANVSGMQTGVKNGGGQKVSKAQAGDIVIFYNNGKWQHVALAINSTTAINGNTFFLGKTPSRVKELSFKDSVLGKNVTWEFWRPNYGNLPPNPIVYQSISSNTYYLKNASTGTYLTVDGAKAANGQNVSVAAKASTKAQQFKIAGGTNNYLYSMLNNSYVLNPYADSPKSGTNVTLYTKDEKGGQQVWGFESVSGGYLLRLKTYDETLALSVDGTNVKVVSANKSDKKQIWTLEPVQSVTLSSISITPPNKTTYYVDEDIDTAGLKVTATYSDKTTKDVTKSAKVSCDLSKAGNVTATVSYTEGSVSKTATFNVSIKEIPTPFEGAGTQEAPYLINNKTDLEALRDLINDKGTNPQYSESYYKQTADIDLENEEWIPIGTGYNGNNFNETYDSSIMFYGSYDGDGHYITNLKQTADLKATGIFGFIRGDQAVVKNLGVKGTISVTWKDGYYIGGIVGQSQYFSTIENCTFTGDITGSTNAGGITARIWQSATIKNCYHLGNVTANENAGGIVGLIDYGEWGEDGDDAVVENYYHANGKVTSKNIAGAIVGNCKYYEGIDNTVHINNCYASSDCGANTNANNATSDTSILLRPSELKTASNDLGSAFINTTDFNEGFPALKWEQTAIEVTTNNEISTVAGDANLDGIVNIADAVLVMQVATNPDKYAQGKSELSIKPQGEINADVDGKKGLSNSDALLIQKFKLGLIDKF